MQGLHVLGETTSPVSDAGEQKTGTDAGVSPHAASHLVNIGTDQLAKVGHFVHKRDFGRQE